MPGSSLGGGPTFCLCGLHDSLTYEYLKKNCKTSLLHFYLIIINIMLLFIRTSQANPNPNHNNTITHGPRPECSPHARPVPTPSYGIPCSLLGQRPGVFNCPLSVVMEENFFQCVPCPVYPERPCSDRIQRPFPLPFKLQYIAIKILFMDICFLSAAKRQQRRCGKGSLPRRWGTSYVCLLYTSPSPRDS